MIHYEPLLTVLHTTTAEWTYYSLLRVI